MTKNRPKKNNFSKSQKKLNSKFLVCQNGFLYEKTAFKRIKTEEKSSTEN